MGFRFRKSVKIAPGVKMNFGKKGVGMSFGRKGARFTVNSSGRATASVGIPGTGLSYSTSFGGKKRKKVKRTTTKTTTVRKTHKERKPASPLNKAFVGIIGVLFCVLMIVHGIINFAQSGWIIAAFGLICGYFLVKFVRNQISEIRGQFNEETETENKKAGD